MSFRRKPPPENVRRVVSLGANCRGVTTNKRGRLVQFESEQERVLILLLERDPSVLDFCSQPETLTYVAADGHPRHYTPDFQVWRTDGRIELHEVTLEARRQAHAEPPLREDVALHMCQQRGWRYLVHTDQTLPHGYAYANLDILSAFRVTSYADPALVSWWGHQLRASGPTHPHVLLDQHVGTADQGRLLSTLYHLLWHDQIQMDWQRPLFWRGSVHPAACVWPVDAARGLKERHP
ncbi:MAG: hypothetical protein EOM24_27980 [Chloroflexia bacterium]|nr:hypothetical protein [Chloroflexia bacterium]